MYLLSPVTDIWVTRIGTYVILFVLSKGGKIPRRRRRATLRYTNDEFTPTTLRISVHAITWMCDKKWQANPHPPLGLLLIFKAVAGVEEGEVVAAGHHIFQEHRLIECMQVFMGHPQQDTHAQLKQMMINGATSYEQGQDRRLIIIIITATL